MVLFELRREEDETGVSGTGVVAHGVIFESGQCVMSWRTEHTSIAVYESIEKIIAIHGHDGKTKAHQVFEYDGKKVSNALVNEYQDKCEGIAVDFPPDTNHGYIWNERKKLMDMFEGKLLGVPNTETLDE
jgi:hypothetical protein